MRSQRHWCDGICRLVILVGSSRFPISSMLLLIRSPLVFSHSVTKTSLPIGIPCARRPNSVVPSSPSVHPSGIFDAFRSSWYISVEFHKLIGRFVECLYFWFRFHKKTIPIRDYQQLNTTTNHSSKIKIFTIQIIHSWVSDLNVKVVGHNSKQEKRSSEISSKSSNFSASSTSSYGSTCDDNNTSSLIFSFLAEFTE